MTKFPLNIQMRDAALAYAARGWPVFPLKAGGKTPLTTHGLRDASTFPRQIVVWWGQWPSANVGVDCGRAGLVVIDVDPDNGGMFTWSALDASVPTLTSRTGGGGYHFIYAQPKGQIPVRSSAGRLGPGVDVRGAGGYIVLPPSLHKSGRPYEWLGQGGEHFGLDAVAPMAARLLARLRTAAVATERSARIRPPTQPMGAVGAYVQSALRGEIERVRLAREGTRNDTLNRAAFALGQLAGAGMLSCGPVQAALVEAAVMAGLDEPEARRTFGNGFSAGLREPRVIPSPGGRSATLSQAQSARRTPSSINWTQSFLVRLPAPMPAALNRHAAPALRPRQACDYHR